MSQVIAVIPVRYGAQRFPGKPLTPLLNKPMIHWVIEGVQQSQLVKKIILATDDQRIADSCSHLPVKIVMTDSELPSGSDRVFQASQNEEEELIINIQGDEPLIEGSVVDKMARGMMEQGDWDMMTFGSPITKEALQSPNTAKIVLNHKSQAIYFSRFPIPYSRVPLEDNLAACLKHIGIYGYKKSFLAQFCQTEAQPIEKMEGLEQLRALYLGGRIHVLPIDYVSWGVDTPDDVPYVEKLLRKKYG